MQVKSGSDYSVVRTQPNCRFWDNNVFALFLCKHLRYGWQIQLNETWEQTGFSWGDNNSLMYTAACKKQFRVAPADYLSHMHCVKNSIFGLGSQGCDLAVHIWKNNITRIISLSVLLILAIILTLAKPNPNSTLIFHTWFAIWPPG